MLNTYVLPSPFAPEIGLAYTTSLPDEFCAIWNRAESTVPLVYVLEDGVPLGPGNAMHQAIREFGLGRFSVWKGYLYFSSSDTTSPNENGRDYRIAVVDDRWRECLLESARDQIAKDDGETIAILLRNIENNNTVIKGLFSQYNLIKSSLMRNHAPTPRRIVELGAGRKPYGALRFLAADAESYIANDLGIVDSEFSKPLIDDVIRLFAWLNPALGESLRRLCVSGAPDTYHVEGFETRGKCLFEDIDVADGSIDLIHSSGALEHVMQPAAVASRMAALLKPGGYAWHFIELRDHMTFWRPLAFLNMTPEQYATINTENRLRASDHLALFAKTGFEICECRFYYYATAPDDSVTNAVSLHIATSMDLVQPWVTPEMRAAMAAPFRDYSLADLSVAYIRVLLRWPG